MTDGVGWAATEIVLFMVAATLVGLAIGWIFGRWLQKRTIAEGYVAELAAQEELARKAEHRLTESNKTLDKLQLRLKGEIERVGELEAQLESSQVAIAALEGSAVDGAELAQLRADLEASVKEGETLTARTAELDDAVAARDAQIGELEAGAVDQAELARLRSEVESGGVERQRLAARASELEDAVAARDAQIGELEAGAVDQAELARLRSDLAACGTEREHLAGRVTELEGLLASPDEAVTEQAEVVAPVAAVSPVVDETLEGDDGPSKEEGLARIAEIAARTAGGAPAADDDLKKVHGIGPKLERTLKGLGISSFKQIANSEPEDIAYVTAALDAFKGRIERDDWMSSAAEEHATKYNEPA